MASATSVRVMTTERTIPLECHGPNLDLVVLLDPRAPDGVLDGLGGPQIDRELEIAAQSR